MRITRRGLVAVTVVGIVGLGCGDRVMAAGPTPAQQCESKKNQAAGAKATCLAKGHAAAAEGRTFNFAQCETNFTNAFAAAEQKAGPGVCPTEGDTAAIEAMVDTCMGDIASALGGGPPPPPPPCTPTTFPATGQTTCRNSTGAVIPCAGTGQDGDIRAGAALSYTDNRDGTITDDNTGLMWEKKSDDGSIHDRDIRYTWANAFAVHIAGLNAAGFAGYTDWRLPNIKELVSIADYEPFFPSVSPAFNTNCVAGCTVLTCSCTSTGIHWSSTSDPSGLIVSGIGLKYGMWGSDGSVIRAFDDGFEVVRAVRGGL